MTSVVLYFQVHQPWRLRRYSVFDERPDYFAAEANGEVCRKVAEKCYRPATRVLREAIGRHGGEFRCAFSITGTVVEQLRELAPDVLDRFRELAETGCVEFLAETYHHSLALLQSRQEFAEQVARHSSLMEELFGQRPRVFRNTELVHSNDVARLVSEMVDERGVGRFSGCLVEGVDRVLAGRSPNAVYRPPGLGGAGGEALRGRGGRAFGLLLRNYRLSDDIAFRFSDRLWGEWPLTAEKFAGWVHQVNGEEGRVCNLFMDFETFGEHQWADTGILDFLGNLPGAVLGVAGGENRFVTPSEALAVVDPAGVYDCPSLTSWADAERDVSAWRGNAMQAGAMEELYRLERAVKERDDARLLEDWRRLTTSDHFYYMCTKGFSDGAVHRYFSPYDSPYDSYINFMNVLDNLRSRLAAASAETSRASHV